MPLEEDKPEIVWVRRSMRPGTNARIDVVEFTSFENCSDAIRSDTELRLFAPYCPYPMVRLGDGRLCEVAEYLAGQENQHPENQRPENQHPENQ